MPFSPEKYKSVSGPGFYTMASLPDFMLPGYGQILAGEKRKGILFLVAHVLNLAVLGVIIFSQSLNQSISWFSKSFNLQLNQGLLKSLGELTLGSPDAFIALTFFVAFALFAARDAYEYKRKLKRQALYHDYVLAMPEAVSSSYIFHIVFLLACMALAFFFLIPLAPPRQITDIEFIQTEENTHEKPLTKVRSAHNARAAGLTRKTEPKEASHASASASQSHAQAHNAKSSSSKSSSSSSSSSSSPAPPPVHVSEPAPHAAPAPPAVVPAPPPVPQPTLSASALPKTNITPTPAAKSAKLNPQPLSPLPSLPSSNLAKPLMPQAFNQLAMAPAVAPSPLHLPLTAPTPSTASGVGSAPRPHALSSSGAAQSSQPTPAPVSVLAGTGLGKSSDFQFPQPAKIGSGKSSAKSGDGPAVDVGPKPKRGTSIGAIPPAGTQSGPLAGPVLKSSSGTPADGKSDNGGVNSGPRPGNSPDSIDDEPDWSPYMADLQKRIRRAWFPSKVGESKRVKVIFTVQRNGEMTNLRLLQSSGMQVVDVAALKAVENAAPFRPLPSHAPTSVDIEFTFDYNVFNGSLR